MKNALKIFLSGIMLLMVQAGARAQNNHCLNELDLWYGEPLTIDTCTNKLYKKKMYVRYSKQIINEDWEAILKDVKKNMAANDTLKRWRSGEVMKKYEHLLDLCMGELREKKQVNITSLEFTSLPNADDFHIGQRDRSFTDTIVFNKNNTEKYQIELLLQWNTAIKAMLLLKDSSLVRIQFENIDKAYERYYNYIFKGMFQYPWESAINDCIFSKRINQDGPSSRQLIVLHPSVVIQLNADKLANLFKDPLIKEALSVDVIGYVWYYSNFKRYFALSAPINFRSDMGAGPGIKLHFSQFNIGFNWHDADRKKGLDATPFVSLSVNLFKKYQEDRGRYEKILKNVKQRMGKEDD